MARAGGGYQRAIVTYIDVLGFRSLIENSKGNWAKIADVAKVLDLVRQHFAKEIYRSTKRAERHSANFRTFTFSDLVLRCLWPADGDDFIGSATAECEHLAMFQTQLACEHNILVRGGLCVGELFTRAKDQLVFGPGMVKAYMLEAEYALYPRIVVDRELAPEIQQRATWSLLINRAEDGAYFLDYLVQEAGGALIGEKDKSLGASIFCKHRDMISRKIAAMSPHDERLKQKLIWLALYHQRSLDVLRQNLSLTASERKVLDSSGLPDGLLQF